MGGGVEPGAEARRRGGGGGGGAPSTFDGNGNFVRGADAVWRYTASRQPVHQATDVVLGDVYPAEVVRYRGRSYRAVPHRWVRRRGDHPLAWVRSEAGVVDRPETAEYLVPTAAWTRRSGHVLGMLAPELHPLALLGLDDVAVAAGVKPATIRAYLHRGQMPDPVSRAGGSPVWTRPTIEGWLESRSRPAPAHPLSAMVAAGRFAPSPTGPLHLGNLRTALVAWLLARSGGRRFLVRIEDLDPVASRADVARGQLDDLAWLGLDWDGPVVHQSSRRERHLHVLDQLVAAGRLYPCYCTRRDVAAALQAAHGTAAEAAYPGTCRRLDPDARAELEAAGRRPAWRLDAGGERVAFVDRVLGPVEGPAGDVVVRRNDGRPAYNLAVVVDDHDSGIDEVVRGDDLVPSTPAQILLSRWLGWEPPSYAHVPLVLGPDGERLAKRHGAVSAGEWRARGRVGDEVRALLAGSLGLPGDVAAGPAAGLVAAFDLAAVPRQPWTVPASFIAD